MEAPTERTKFIADHVGRILVAAMDRDIDTASEALDAVGSTYGHNGVYGVCCAMASVVHKLAFPDIKRGDGTLNGDGIMIIEQLPGTEGDPEDLWAARFVAAYINGDTDTTTSLFYGGLDDRDRTVAGVSALIRMAADIARHAEEELK